MGKRAARTCAAYLTKFWKDSQLPMRYNWGLSCMPLGGYNTYTTTQSPINKQPHRRRVPSLHAAAPQVKLVLRSQHQQVRTSAPVLRAPQSLPPRSSPCI